MDGGHVSVPEGEGRYDVVILGGGLAGLTLGAAAEATHARRRRSSSPRSARDLRPRPRSRSASRRVELSAHYFGEVLGLKDHLELISCRSGLRFFFPADGNTRLATRVEWGRPLCRPCRVPARPRPVRERARSRMPERASSCSTAASVQEVELGRDEHASVGARRRAETVHGRWVVDATADEAAPAPARSGRGRRSRDQRRLVPPRAAAWTSRLSRRRRRGSRAWSRAACASSAPTT